MAVVRRDKNLKWFGPGMRKLYLIILVGLIASANNGYDGSMLNAVNAFPEYLAFFKIETTGASAANINTSYNIGGFIGGVIAGPLADVRGRRFGMFAGCVIIIIGCFVQGASSGVTQLIVGRFIVGLGVPVTVTSAPVWIAELSPVDLRGHLVGFYNTFWFVGSTLAASVALSVSHYDGDLKWRYPLYLQSIPSAVIAIFIFFLPESPRWLISKGRDDEALKILATYHGDGDQESESVQSQYKEITTTLALEKKVSNIGAYLAGYLDLFNSRAALQRLMICFMIPLFAGNQIISYYITPMLTKANINTPTIILALDLVLNILSWLGAVFGAFFLIERLGRRPMFLLGNAFTIVGMAWIGICTSQALDTSNTSATYAAVVGIYLTNVFYAACWTPLQALYPTEIWPFTERARAVGVTQVFFGISGYVWSWANALGLGNLGWGYYFVIVAVNAVWLVLMFFFFPETKGRTLEELHIIFSSPNPVKKAKEPIVFNADGSIAVDTKESA
ncbi:hypothetical protein HK096_005850 [Nowakowskiella sp. JEL0078]|nr:hypothetical protein HK096_005850 [Nowakowskiella sp. JEL0078]